MLCAEAGTPGDVYNLASGVETSIRGLAETILALSGSASELQLGPPRDWDRSGHRFGSTDKARREIGFTAATGLELGLRQTIDWMNEQMEVIDRAIAQHADRIELSVPETSVS